jgi:hypothetical protein
MSSFISFIYRVRRWIYLFVAVVVLAIAAVVLYILFFSPEARTARALQGITLLSASSTPYTFGIFGPTPLPVPYPTSTTLLEYAQEGNTQAGIVSTLGIGIIKLFAPESKTFTTTSGHKAQLSLSPKGTMIAYAEESRTSTGSTTAYVAPIWHAHILDIASGNDIDLGPGSSPQFFVQNGNTYLFFVAPTGLTVYDTAKHGSVTANYQNPALQAYPPRISIDGKYLALPNPTTKLYSFYTVTKAVPWVAFSFLGTAPITLSDVMWRGASVYGISATPKESALYAIDPKGKQEASVLTSLRGTYRFLQP